MDKKYRITYSGEITGKTPNYILSLRVHLKGIYPETERYGREDFHTILHCINSLIDDFSFKMRNTRYRGSILKRIIQDDCLKICNMSDEKVILTVSFTPLKK